MAQVASKTCDICSSALTEHYCIDCEQYFCGTCKGLHNRQRGTRKHVFQSSSDLIQEVKSKCKEHDEDYIFLCSSCDVPVCKICMTGKHNGHKVANIDVSVTNLTRDIKIAIEKKLDIATQNLKELECGLQAFDLDVNSVIKGVIEEGQKNKAMIDRLVQNLIDDINSKAKEEQEKLKQMVKAAQTGLEDITLLDQRRTEHEKTRRDAALHQKLKTLNNDISRFQPVTVPMLPTVKYTPKGISERNMANLFGTYRISETHSVQKSSDLIYKSEERSDQFSKTPPTGKLYRCTYCGHKTIIPHDREILQFCQKCVGIGMNKYIGDTQ